MLSFSFILPSILLLSSIVAPAWLSITRSELEPGQSYTATATVYGAAGHTLDLRGPTWLTIGAPEPLGADTVRWRVTVAGDALPTRGPESLRLVVDGQVAAETAIRVDGWVWSTPKRATVWLPVVMR